MMPAWLALSFFFTFGWIPVGGVQMYGPPHAVISDGMFYQRFEAEATIANVIRLGGSLEVRDWLMPTGDPRTGLAFWPEGLDSIVFAEIVLGPLSAGVEHACIHPIVPYLGQGIPLSNLWDRAESRVYLRIGGKL